MALAREKHRAAAVLQAAVRKRVTLQLIFARVDREWELTAKRIDGACATRPVVLAFFSPHRTREDAGRHDCTENSTGTHTVNGSGSEIGTAPVDFAVTERRVQRLVELAQCDESGGWLCPCSDRDSQECAPAAVQEVVLSLESFADQSDAGEELDQELQVRKCGWDSADLEKTGISDFSLTSLTSTSPSSSALWDHESPLSSTAASVRSRPEFESFDHGAGVRALEEISQSWIQSAEPTIGCAPLPLQEEEEEDDFSGLFGARPTSPEHDLGCSTDQGSHASERGEISSPSSVPHAATSNSPHFSTAAALSQSATPCRTLADEMHRDESCREEWQSPQEMSRCDAVDSSPLDSGEARQHLKEQRRLLLENELRWTRQALESRKRHLKISRLVGDKVTSANLDQ